MTTSTPTPTSTTHRFPVYPLLLNDGSGNVDTTSLAAGSPEAATNMWRDFISSTAHKGAHATTPQKHIWGLLSGLTISEEEGTLIQPRQHRYWGGVTTGSVVRCAAHPCY